MFDYADVLFQVSREQTWTGAYRATHICFYVPADLGRVQQLTGPIGQSIGPAYVRPVSCWTAFITIQ